MISYSTESTPITCPYCGQTIEVIIDMSIDNQEYIEDCSVCCRPITLVATIVAGEVQVIARHENE